MKVTRKPSNNTVAVSTLNPGDAFEHQGAVYILAIKAAIPDFVRRERPALARRRHALNPYNGVILKLEETERVVPLDAELVVAAQEDRF